MADGSEEVDSAQRLNFAVHVVPDGVDTERFDKYLLEAKVWSDLISKNQIRKESKQGGFQINGEAVGSQLCMRVNPGDRIERFSVAPPKPKPVFKLDLEVLMEDDSIAVVHKPAGYHVKGIGVRKIDNALASNLRPSSAPDRLPGGPVAVHRLDARTSGLLVVAKTRTAHMSLSQQFDRNFEDASKGKVHKKYIALVCGRLEGEGECLSPIDGRNAHTKWKAIHHTESGSFDWEWVTTVEAQPMTGRTHQIRIHLTELGHPICGDDLHTSPKYVVLRGGGLFLTSTEVSLDHPLTGERTTIKSEMPYKFTQFLRRQAARLGKKRPGKELNSSWTAGEAGQTCLTILQDANEGEQGSKSGQPASGAGKGLGHAGPADESSHKRRRGKEIPPYLALPPSPTSPRPGSPAAGAFQVEVEAKGSLFASREEESSAVVADAHPVTAEAQTG